MSSMKALGIVLAAFVCLSAACAQAPEQVPTVTIRKPTVIAFFRTVPESEANRGSSDDEALSDFEFYAAKVEPRLKKAGIELRVMTRSSFRVRIGNRVRTFRPGPLQVGYYLIAPGKEPHTEYGVMTDEDLTEVAAKYFGLPISPPPGSPRPTPL